MAKILIYTEQITPRIEYIFDFIFRDFGGIEFLLTTNLKEFTTFNLPKINFSHHYFTDEINYSIDDIFLENDIRLTTNYDSLNPIGKCFYWLSRYEEYIAQPNQFDHHNRFLGSDLNYSEPIVDQICSNIQSEIKSKFPVLNFKRRVFQQINTHDVDHAWKYKFHSPKILIGSLIKKALKGQWKLLKEQVNVLSGKLSDPYDQFLYYQTLAEKHQVQTIFFWLLGDYNEFDKNHSHQNQNQQDLIREITSWASIGIHPSYISNFNETSLPLEIKRLEKIASHKILKSRQHFIKLNFPHTYQQLLKSGISEDYTMGFAHKIGFRAGTSTPFRWFDLSRNEQTLLTIYPFVAMDVTLKNYLNLSPEEAIIELQQLKQKIKNVNGNFITLFHQSNLTDEWKPWRKVYESLFDD